MHSTDLDTTTIEHLDFDIVCEMSWHELYPEVVGSHPEQATHVYRYKCKSCGVTYMKLSDTVCFREWLNTKIIYCRDCGHDQPTKECSSMVRLP